MNNEKIYRCDECFAIYESLSDLEYSIMVDLDSGYAKMIGINDFDIDAQNNGRLTIDKLKKYLISFNTYPVSGITMYSKNYDGKKVIFEQFKTISRNE